MTSLLELTVIADENDADYLHSICNIDEDTLKRLRPLLEAIRDCDDDHNWCTSEYGHSPSPEEMYPDIDPELIQEFDEEYVPGGEYGVHTIDTLKVRRIVIVEEMKYV